MPNFLIKPKFNTTTAAATFETTSLNKLVRAQYSDDFGFFQRQFGVYSYMQLTKDLQYKIYYPKGSPLIWQTHNSCAWTPSKTLSFGENTITPCKVKINEQLCYDELFDSAFKGLLQWGGRPNVSMDPTGTQMLNDMVRTIVENATIGARTVMVGGQVHNLASVAYETGASTNVQEAFQKSSAACAGWLKLVATLDSTYSWLEQSVIDADDVGADGATFTTNPLTLYDTLLAGAPKKLRAAIQRGGIRGYGTPYYPIMLVSPSVFSAVYNQYQTQNVTAATNKPRITVREFMENDGRGGMRPVLVYYIDNTVVIPVDEIDNYDEVVTGTSHFAYLTLSGVIQLGASFANIPSVDESQVGLMVQMSQNAEDYGTTKILAHSLLGNAINDVDYITGSYAYVIPD